MFLIKSNPDPRVESVEPNRIAKIAGQTLPTGMDRTDADLSALAVGKGGNKVINADIAIIDTGIDLTHPDLNVFQQKTFVSGARPQVMMTMVMVAM